MKKKSIFIGTGIFSLCMMFCILCMVILAILTYQDGKQTLALSVREQAMIEAYYDAEAQATLLHAKMRSHPMESLTEVAQYLENEIAETSSKITIDVKNDILHIQIKLNDTMSFLATFDGDANILTWHEQKENELYD